MKPDNENRGWRAAISQRLVGPRATQFSSSWTPGSPNCPTGGARSTASRDRGGSSFFSKLSAIPVLMFSAFVGITPAHAVPSFARQTGMTCNACHTTIPELTAFGRQFKMGGYTEKVDGAPKFPLAMWMIGG
ncbi:MAG: hypothetical protein PF443_11815, partial [Allgaiera sp.]|nr:hypothetical protein [Allgaiera sp.]